MQVLSLLDKLGITIPYQINKELGYGADGVVYDLKNDSGVVKFSVLYDNFEQKSLKDKYNDIINIINYIISKKPQFFCEIFEFKDLGFSSRDFLTYVDNKELKIKQNYILYCYKMEKLNKISEDESKVFHTIVSHEDSNKIKKYSSSKIKEILKGLSRGLDFDFEKVILFVDNINKSNIIHCDIHPRNIMKDNYNNYKLIDFDRSKIKE